MRPVTFCYGVEIIGLSINRRKVYNGTSVVRLNTDGPIDRLKAKGERIDTEDLTHLSPARYDHINPYGRYQFLVDRWAGKKPLRPIKL
jgi:hypothetical protein